MRRRLLHITEERLGNSIGVPFQEIRRYESGARHISAGHLWKIADALQCDIAWFFDDEAE